MLSRAKKKSHAELMVLVRSAVMNQLMNQSMKSNLYSAIYMSQANHRHVLAELGGVFTSHLL